MYRLGLVLWVAAVAAQYDSLESRSAYPGKPTSLSPLYTPGLGAASHAYRDNSYEDNAVTPTPAPTPIYRTVNSPQQVRPDRSFRSELEKEVEYDHRNCC